MGVLEKIYDIAPIFFQNIMVSLSGYQKNITRYGKKYYEHRDFLKEFDTLSLNEQLKYQEEKFLVFL